MPPRAPLPLLLLLAAALAGCEPPPPREALAPDSLRTQLGQLASLAAEASLFTDELAAGHLNAAYAWVHQQALASEVRRVSGALAQPAPAPLQARQRDALLLATTLQLDLARVADVRGDGTQLQSLGSRFTLVQRQARALGGGH